MSQLIETVPLAALRPSWWSEFFPTIGGWSDGLSPRTFEPYLPILLFGVDVLFRGQAPVPTRWSEHGYLRSLAGTRAAVRTAVRYERSGMPGDVPKTFGAYLDELASRRHLSSPVSLAACRLSDKHGRMVNDCLGGDVVRALLNDIAAASGASALDEVPSNGPKGTLTRTPTLENEALFVPSRLASVSLSMANGSATPYWYSSLLAAMITPATQPVTVVLAPASMARILGGGCPPSAPTELGHASAWSVKTALNVPGSVAHTLLPGDALIIAPCVPYATFSEALPPDAVPSVVLTYHWSIDEAHIASQCAAAQLRCLQESEVHVRYPDGELVRFDLMPPLLYE